MKKLIMIFAVAIIMAAIFVSCSKKDSVVQPQKQSVNVIAGSFIAQDGDITLKSAVLTKVSRTWTMLTNNGTFYTPNYWSKVDGREFITGSAAYNFWHNSANNPVSFPVSQAVYSNLTPDENLRLITETKNGPSGTGDVVYLGILDFNPGTASFPMTLHSLRLGDKITLNTNALTQLPGGNNLTFKVTINVAPVDLATTKNVTLGGTSSTPSGTELQWSDIQYGAAVASEVVVAGTGDQVVYDELSGKVTGITITITETGNGGSVITKTVAAADLGPGHGLALTLTTTKIGWYDSGTIGFNDSDITITALSVPVN